MAPVLHEDEGHSRRHGLVGGMSYNHELQVRPESI